MDVRSVASRNEKIEYRWRGTTKSRNQGGSKRAETTYPAWTSVEYKDEPETGTRIRTGIQGRSWNQREPFLIANYTFSARNADPINRNVCSINKKGDDNDRKARGCCAKITAVRTRSDELALAPTRYIAKETTGKWTTNGTQRGIEIWACRMFSIRLEKKRDDFMWKSELKRKSNSVGLLLCFLGNQCEQLWNEQSSISERKLC